MNLIIAANWKMHKTRAETVDFCRALLGDLDHFEGAEVLICPPFTALSAAADLIGGSALKLGAQDMHWEREGAFTGEIAGPMLMELGVEYVIIGHSERRHIMGEDNRRIRLKLEAALEGGLKPILCVGETEAQREEGSTAGVIKDQLIAALEGLAPGKTGALVVAYEPVWAIGTGRAARPEDADEACSLIRDVIGEILGSGPAEKVPIQYGGSVKEANIGSFVELDSIQGALVGGASLEADSFSALIRAARKAVQS